jgi:hypothetical protein
MSHALLSFRTKQPVAIGYYTQFFQAHKMPENEKVHLRTTENKVKLRVAINDKNRRLRRSKPVVERKK